MKNSGNYRFILDPSSRKLRCASCGIKSFVGMIDQETGEFLFEYGRCDREVKCGFFKHPVTDGYTSLIKNKMHSNPIIIKKPTFHCQKLVTESMQTSNNLLRYFELVFGKFHAEKIQEKYRIGTYPELDFGTVFWQIDELNQVRAGKIINYFPNGRRTKSIDWVHAFQKRKKQISEFNLSQCLFGLHLISEDKTSTIAIVESEKTACIMSVVYPQFLWLACGAKGEFKTSKLEPIKSRKIVAYPDCEVQKNGMTTYEEWRVKSVGFNADGYDICVSDLLEVQSSAKQKLQGVDIADFFL